ncbi:MAG: alpha/beta fold hydrolase [Anaerolineales bacterium]|nr:alpha/beta fold hydrolase [Anaerolineales bacterium]
MKLRLIRLAILCCVLLAACTLPQAGAAGLPTPFIVRSSATATFTASPSPSATLTPTATPLPLHPLSIEYLRQRSYPATQLTIEEVLENGSNYARYIASYLSDGLKQYGLLTVPFGEVPATGWPVIIFNHGYIAPQEYRTTERYIAYVDRLASAGYIVFRPDYRGHDRSEGIARGAYGRPDYVIDVLNATAALKAYADADPNRIGMWGHSMGGYITLRAMVVDPDIKAGVIWAGVISAYADMIDIGGRPRFGTRSLLEPTARQRPTPNSGLRSRPTATWTNSPARCSCTTGAAMPPCRFLCHTKWPSKPAPPGKPPSCLSMMAIITTSPPIFPLPCGARSNFSICT